jgi:hypothetical protein
VVAFDKQQVAWPYNPALVAMATGRRPLVTYLSAAQTHSPVLLQRQHSTTVGTTENQPEPGDIRAAMEAMNVQTEATIVTQLLDKVTLCDAPQLRSGCVKKLQGRRPRWLYRASSEKSQGGPDHDGNILAGDPTWAVDSDMGVALHFAEFHSDESNRKKTALVSGTNDFIRALKKMYDTADFTRDQKKIFITVIYTSNYYMASELLEYLREAGLWNHLSQKTRERLDSPDHKFLHDSEVVFLHKIRKDDIKLQVSLQELSDRSTQACIPELDKPVGRQRLWPKGIRARIHENSDFDFAKTAKRFVNLYSILTQDRQNKTKDSLVMAQALLYDDEFLEPAVKEEGYGVLQCEIATIRAPARQYVGFADEA